MDIVILWKTPDDYTNLVRPKILGLSQVFVGRLVNTSSEEFKEVYGIYVFDPDEKKRISTGYVSPFISRKHVLIELMERTIQIIDHGPYGSGSAHGTVVEIGDERPIILKNGEKLSLSINDLSRNVTVSLCDFRAFTFNIALVSEEIPIKIPRVVEVGSPIYIFAEKMNIIQSVREGIGIIGSNVRLSIPIEEAKSVLTQDAIGQLQEGEKERKRKLEIKLYDTKESLKAALVIILDALNAVRNREYAKARGRIKALKQYLEIDQSLNILNVYRNTIEEIEKILDELILGSEERELALQRSIIDKLTELEYYISTLFIK